MQSGERKKTEYIKINITDRENILFRLATLSAFVPERPNVFEKGQQSFCGLVREAHV
jgi:hypothetical protein